MSRAAMAIRLAATSALTAGFVWLLVTDTHKAILRPLWTGFTEYVTWLFN